MIAREPIKQYLTQNLRERALQHLRDSKGKIQGELELLTRFPSNQIALLDRMPECITPDVYEDLIRTAEIMSTHPRDGALFAAGFFARQNNA